VSIRLLLVDDHAAFGASLARLLAVRLEPCSVTLRADAKAAVKAAVTLRFKVQCPRIQHSMRHQHRQRHPLQHRPRDTPQQPFACRAVAVTAHHKQLRPNLGAQPQ
jgi:hypothetical protein